MENASLLGKSLLAAALIQSEHKSGSGGSGFNGVLQHQPCDICVTEQHSKSELCLYTACLGLIRESLEGPGPVLFIEQQLTMHILCERGRAILLCKYM